MFCALIPSKTVSLKNRLQTEFGFVLPNRDILVDDLRVRGIGKTDFETEEAASEAEVTDPPSPAQTTEVFFDDRYLPTNVFKMEDLLSGFFFFFSGPPPRQEIVSLGQQNGPLTT
jgi:N-methylhydantoinase A/oxoprolinase/acetone carboxylase beta subunit